MEVTTAINRIFFSVKRQQSKQNLLCLKKFSQLSPPPPPSAYKIPVSALSSEGLNGDNR